MMDTDETDEYIGWSHLMKKLFSIFFFPNSLSIFISVLNLVLLLLDIPSSENSLDPDQLLVGVSTVIVEKLNVLIIFGRRNFITLIDTLEITFV